MESKACILTIRGCNMSNLTSEFVFKQEQACILSQFSLKDGHFLGQLLVEAAGDKVEKTAISVSFGERIIYVRAGSETALENDYWARRKRNVVHHHGHSSMFVRLANNCDEEEYYRMSGLDPAEYAIHGGGFPIVVNHVGLVGTVVISGLPMEEDHAICYEALKRFKEAHGTRE
ncbi:hypothetical protein D3C74_269980 [compost metagenome]